jgi:hypothetical protein
MSFYQKSGLPSISGIGNRTAVWAGNGVSFYFFGSLGRAEVQIHIGLLA